MNRRTIVRAKNLTVQQITLSVACIVWVIEIFIMLLFDLLALRVGAMVLALLDAILLASIATPLIYLLIIKPYVLARDEALAAVTHLALHDPLTKLANRRLFVEQFKRDLAFAIRHGAYGGLLLIDLDDFKRINDTLGHDYGDKMLIEIARRLSCDSRPEDVVVRLGGDEFVVLLPHMGTDSTSVHLEVLRVAERIQQALFEPVVISGRQFQIGCSIGALVFGDVVASVTQLMNDVDRAMYKAKGAGKGRIVFCQASESEQMPANTAQA